MQGHVRVHFEYGQTAPAKLTTEPAADGEAVLYMGGEVHRADDLPPDTVVEVTPGENDSELHDRAERSGYNCTLEAPS